MRQSLVMQLFP